MLSAAERQTLALAMLRDVIGAAKAAPSYSQVLVVSHDERILALVKDLGASAVLEHEAGGYSAAAAQASAVALEGGAAALLVLPGDVPLVTASDLERIVAAARGKAVGLVAARDGDGTNAVLARPPGLLAFQFGPGSFRAHLRAAAAVGEYAVVEAPNLALDIDTPADLAELLVRDGLAGTVTGRYVSASGFAERLSAATRT